MESSVGIQRPVAGREKDRLEFNYGSSISNSKYLGSDWAQSYLTLDIVWELVVQRNMSLKPIIEKEKTKDFIVI